MADTCGHTFESKETLRTIKRLKFHLELEEKMMGRLLIRGLLISLALWTLPAQAQQVSKPQVEAMIDALRLAAPKTGVQDDCIASGKLHQVSSVVGQSNALGVKLHPNNSKAAQQ